MDGKRLRGSKRQKHDAKHILGIFSHNSLQCNGSQELSCKDNEITAASQALNKINLRGLTITGDAIFAQRAIVEKIVENQRNSLFTVKENQARLKREIETAFNETRVCREYKEEVTKVAWLNRATQHISN